MKLLKAKIFVLVVFIIDNIQTELSPDGDNVCMSTETYEEKVKVIVRKPKVIKKKKWCWSLKKAFSCDRSITSWENVMEVRALNRTKIIPKCCDGYKEEREQVTKCLPVCLKGCINGKCTAPEICACFSGFYGSECQKACPEGLWGENCINLCDCSNYGKCDKTTGVCDCEHGWRGDRCESTCDSGYYGYKCQMKCNCANNSCNHVTGECFTTTAQPEISTMTEIASTKKLTEVSTSEIPKMTPISAIEDISKFSEKSSVEELITTLTIADSWSIVESTMKETDFSVMRNPSKNTQEITSPEPTSDTTPTADVFSSETETEESSRETKTQSIQVLDNQTGFWDSFERSTHNVNKEVINDLSDTSEHKSRTVPISSTTNNINSINVRGSEQEIDKTETDNFINENKGSSNRATMLKIFHFLPGLFVFSSVSFLTFISFTMWLINKHHNKTRKTLTATEKKEKMLQMDEKIKYLRNSFFLSDSCTNNEVYLTDADLNRTRPALETFKPLTVDKSLVPSEKEIR